MKGIFHHPLAALVRGTVFDPAIGSEAQARREAQTRWEDTEKKGIVEVEGANGRSKWTWGTSNERNKPASLIH